MARVSLKHAHQAFKGDPCDGIFTCSHAKGMGQNLFAIWWFRQAAMQNMAVAQATLGLMYELGRGVEQSNHCAYAWFKLAGDKGSAPARKKRDSLRALMTSEQIDDAEALADTLLQNSECPATR